MKSQASIHVYKFEENGKHIVAIELRPALPGVEDDRWEYDTAKQAEQALRSALKLAEKLLQQGTVSHIELQKRRAE